MSSFQVRVYYEDTDFSGYVYHANYLKYCERARSAYLHSVGVDQNAMFAAGSAFVVRRMECEFLKPAKFDNVLEVETQLIAIMGARFNLAQLVKHGNNTVFSAHVTIAIVGKNGKPLRIPETLKTMVLQEDSAIQT